MRVSLTEAVTAVCRRVGVEGLGSFSAASSVTMASMPYGRSGGLASEAELVQPHAASRLKPTPAHFRRATHARASPGSRLWALVPMPVRQGSALDAASAAKLRGPARDRHQA